MDAMQEQGWDCYPEVEVPYGGRADIVGVRPFPFLQHRQCIHIVEVKTSWTLSLLEQAEARTYCAHYVSIAAPSRRSAFYERLCRERGVGMLQVRYSGEDTAIDPYIALEPRLVRHKHKFCGNPGLLLETLHEDMKRYAPGTQSGYSTAFSRTMDRCEKFVREHPGCTVKDLVSAVDHHYASIGGFKQGILSWLDKRDGIEARKEGPAFRFYPVGAPSVQAELSGIS